MELSRAKELMEIERLCVERANICNRDCGKCALVQDDKELLEAYGAAIRAIEIADCITRGLEALEALDELRDKDMEDEKKMAELIAWEDLKVGTKAFEEWVYGTGTIPVYVVGVVDKNHLRMHYGNEEDGNSWTKTTKKSSEFRYWNTEPTLEHREFTRWEEK